MSTQPKQPKQPRRRKAGPYALRLDGKVIRFENIDAARSEKLKVAIEAVKALPALAGFVELSFAAPTLDGVEGSAGATMTFKTAKNADAAFEAMMSEVLDEGLEEALKGARWYDPEMNAMVNGD